jgi:hypothetical protein
LTAAAGGAAASAELGAEVAAADAAAAGGASAAKLNAGQEAEINPRTISSCFIAEILLE